MEHFTILTQLLLYPLIGSLAIAVYSYFFKKYSEDMCIVICLISMFGQIVLGALLWLGFDPSNPDFQFQEKLVWFKDWKIFYSVGIDAFSIFIQTSFVNKVSGSYFSSFSSFYFSYFVFFLIY